MLKETSLCMGCMNDKTYDGPCRLCGYSDDDPCIPAYLVPKTFLAERYIVGKLISYNGEGAVYMGYDTAAGVKVTIKEFMPDMLCTRKKGETEITVNHDMLPLYKTYMSEFLDLNRTLMKSRGMAHIQTVLDVFMENNTCYTVFEYINGMSLKTYLANSSGTMTWDQVKELFPPILTTLSLVHAANVIHRGISPQTLFFTDKGELRLAGFAISAARTTNTEIACEVYSGFAAPEQYKNEINGTWTDVYGIAALLYRCLTGTNPPEAIARTPGSMPEPSMLNRNIPENVSRVIMQGMRVEPDKRIRSITEFVDLLFAQPKYIPDERGARESSRPASVKEQRKLKKQKKERAKTIAVLVIIGIVLIAFAVVFAKSLNGTLLPEKTQTAEATAEAEQPQQTTAPVQTTSASQTEQPDTPPEPTTILPDFTNRRFETTKVKYENWIIFVATYEYSDEYSADMMFDQSIEPGTEITAGTTIEVKVSKGRRLVPLPDYTDKLLPDYINELSSQNIKYQVENKKTNDVPSGNVAGCSKEIGDLVNVENGEMIIVYVAQNFKEEPADAQETSDAQDGEELPEGGIPVETEEE